MAVWTVSLSLCLLMALSASVEANPVGSKACGVCSVGWSSFGCRCFKFFDYLRTWIDAEKTCLHVKGNLASVHSPEEYKFIQDLVKSKTHDSMRAWIGGHDHAKEGVWLWTDGSKMNYQIWTLGNPDNFNKNEHCLEMNYSSGNWNDDTCYKTKPFVCVI